MTRAALLALLALLALAILPAGEDQALREQLLRGAPPWYDAERDGWRRVEPRREREPPPPKDVPPPSGGGLPADVFAWALIALAAGGIAVLVWRAWRSAGDGALPAPSPAAAAAGRGADLAALPVPAGTVDIEAALAAARARGDWGAAVVLLYARLLLRLGDAGAVVLAPGTTNRAYCRAARAWAGGGAGRQAVPTALDRLTAAFEAVRFGGEPADGGRFARLEQLERAAATALDGQRG